MTLIKDKPFEPQILEEDRNTDYLIFTVRLNKDEAQELAEARKILKQPKDSTAFKQLAKIGYKRITSQENKVFIETIFENKRKNLRTGFNEVE